MEFPVKLTQNAKLEVESAYLWLKQYDATYADQWFRGLMNAIATLQSQPQRCALARENENFPVEIRQLLYGQGKTKYRIIFTIQDMIVYVLSMRHGAQSSLTFNPLDLEQ